MGGVSLSATYLILVCMRVALSKGRRAGCWILWTTPAVAPKSRCRHCSSCCRHRCRLFLLESSNVGFPLFLYQAKVYADLWIAPTMGAVWRWTVAPFLSNANANANANVVRMRCANVVRMWCECGANVARMWRECECEWGANANANGVRMWCGCGVRMWCECGATSSI